MLSFSIQVEEHEFVIQRWDEIKTLIRKSFKKSEFSQEFSMDFVLDDTFNGVPKPSLDRPVDPKKA